MSELSATNCGCGNSMDNCGCGCGMSSCVWIILLLCCCGGWGRNGDGCGCGKGFSHCRQPLCVLLQNQVRRMALTLLPQHTAWEDAPP